MGWRRGWGGGAEFGCGAFGLVAGGLVVTVSMMTAHTSHYGDKCHNDNDGEIINVCILK